MNNPMPDLADWLQPEVIADIVTDLKAIIYPELRVQVPIHPDAVMTSKIRVRFDAAEQITILKTCYRSEAIVAASKLLSKSEIQKLRELQQ
jgi:hypothetical protein